MAENKLLTEPISKLFLKYVSFNVLSMTGLSLYILADTFFVSKALGADGLASLNYVIPIVTFLSGIGLLLGMGGASLYAIERGSGRMTEGNKIFSLCAFFGALIGITIAILVFAFADQITLFLGAKENTLSNTQIYLKTYIAFAPAFLLNNIMVCFVRNDGNPNLAMWAMLLGSISNIILDYVFMFILNLGMFGAAFATGLSPVIGLCVSSMHFIKKRNSIKITGIDLKLKTLAKISLTGLQSFVTEVSSAVIIFSFNIIILKVADETAVAAYGITANLALVATAVFTGIAQGIQPIISTNYGAAQNTRVKQTLKNALFIAVGTALFLYGISFAFSETIIGVFNSENNPVLGSLAKTSILTYFTAFIFSGFNIVAASYFASVSQGTKAFIISVLKGIVLLLPALLLLSTIFGLHGVWLSVPVAELITFIITLKLILKEFCIKKDLSL